MFYDAIIVRTANKDNKTNKASKANNANKANKASRPTTLQGLKLQRL